MDSVEARLTSFILVYCLPGESAENLPLDLALRRNGILDSLSLLKLVRFVETEFHIEVEPNDIEGNFDTIQALAAFIDGRLGTSSRG